MGSLDKSTWRLRTAALDIPFKLANVKGTFERDSAEIEVEYIVHSEDLINFILILFPPPLQYGAISVPTSSTLPGMPSHTPARASFESLDTGKPIDPFGLDPTADDGTYFELIKVTAVYTGQKNVGVDPANPQTFLEISANTTGQFLHSSVPDARWNEADGEREKSPNLTFTVVVPETDWNLRWNQIPFQIFSNTIIHRLRESLGCVNSAIFPPLFDAEPETLLFIGFNYSEAYTWRDGLIGTPPITIDIKMDQKRVVTPDGEIAGHNHFWRAGKGWQRLYQADGSRAYKLIDLNGIFSV